MNDRSWLELNQSVSRHLDASCSAIERYRQRLDELTLPIVSAAANINASAQFDSSVLADAANRLKTGMPEMEQIASTINIEALGALCDAMLAFTKSLEAPRFLNFILDDNNFSKIAYFLQNEDRKYLEVFYRICSTSKVIPALESMIIRASAITQFKTDMTGLKMLKDEIVTKISQC